MRKIVPHSFWLRNRSLRPGDSAYPLPVSSDPFADLARSLNVFCGALRDVIKEHPAPQPGSPADKECEGEPLAAEWGQRPSRDTRAAIFLTAVSCADHLAACADVITARRAAAALYTLTRSAVEAAATSCYLLDPGIDAAERVRRYMNWRLEGLSEEMNLAAGLDGPDAAAYVIQAAARADAIARGASQHGFEFHARKGYRAAYIGDKPPHATELIEKCASATTGLGAAYQRLLSAVVHAQSNGLTRLVLPMPMSAGSDLAASHAPGVQISITANRAALDLLAGPLCASTLVEGLFPFFGWDMDLISPAVVRMLHTWGRIAGTPYPGPELR